METIWFCLVAVMIAGYVVLDGFDLGAGIVHLLVARTDAERQQVLRSIGPVWDGNEVWLLAGGGTLYFAFPALYASSFSGFYLPLMMVLWLLILRGISIEFRSHIDSPTWKPLWDVVFFRSQCPARHFLRRGAGQRGPRRAARRERRLLPAALDQLQRQRRRRHSGLVHDSGRRVRVPHAHVARRALGGLQDRRRSAQTRTRLS